MKLLTFFNYRPWNRLDRLRSYKITKTQSNETGREVNKTAERYSDVHFREFMVKLDFASL